MTRVAINPNRGAGKPHPPFSRACLHRALYAEVASVEKVESRPQEALHCWRQPILLRYP